VEWIETAQKVAPWAAGLPVAQKLVLSLVIVSIGAFALLLLWHPALPVPTTSVNGKSIGATSPLTIIVNSSASAAEAAAQFAKEISTPAGMEKLERNIEKAELKRVIRDLVSIETGNVSTSYLLQRYAIQPNPGSWQLVQDVVARTAPIISDVADLLEKFDGDLVFKDLETYRELRRTISSRVGLYASLSNMPPPSNDAEKAELREFAGNLNKLIYQIRIVQERLSIYLMDE
jgi:hypothetical protein